jgi:hypothetical protein
MREADIDTLNELLHDNLIFNIPTGQTITKLMDIENYRSGLMRVYDVETSDCMISTIEDVCNVAVTIYLKAKYGNQVIDGRYRYLRVWKLTNNAWKVIAGSGIQIQ